MANEPIEQTFPASRDQVWEALQETVRELNYKNVNENPAAGTIEFRTGLSLWTWRGQQVTATVRELAPNQTQLSLAGGSALKIQATSWGEMKRIAKKVISRVEQRLAVPQAHIHGHPRADHAPGSAPPG